MATQFTLPRKIVVTVLFVFVLGPMSVQLGLWTTAPPGQDGAGRADVNWRNVAEQRALKNKVLRQQITKLRAQAKLARKPVADDEVPQAVAKFNKAGQQKQAGATASNGAAGLDFRAGAKRLAAQIKKLQHGKGARCSCARTLQPDHPVGGLGNQFHNYASHMLAALESDRMLILPGQVALDGIAQTAQFVNAAVTSDYATRSDQCIDDSLDDRDGTLNCFFEDFSRCRPEDLAKACDPKVATKARLDRRVNTGEMHYCEITDCKSQADNWRAQLWGEALHARVLSGQGWSAILNQAKLDVSANASAKMLQALVHEANKSGTTTIVVQVAKKRKKMVIKPIVKKMQPFAQFSDLWLFSQIVGNLWRLKPRIKNALAASPVSKQLKNTKYIAFHIRLTDNINSLMDGHGLDPGKVYNMSHYMNIAGMLRREDPELQTIYIAADEFDFDVETAPYRDKWEFVKIPDDTKWKFVMEDDEEADPNDLYRKGAFQKMIEDDEDLGWEFYLRNPQPMDSLLDLEVLQRAAYIVGSMTSNFFTLATELNYYHHNDLRERWRTVDRVAWEIKVG